MAKLIWSRNMTRDRLHESEDKRKDLIDFYDYDELLETLDDDQVDDLIDSDERMLAMDNAYYDEDVRPKIEAQTLDGIVLLVERPEEDEEEPKEEPEEESEVEESLNESEDEYPEDEKVDNELPELEGLAILADEIPEEFPDAKIVDDGDGFVLEDGDTKYDMYAIPEDKVEEFMDKCMDDPMEDVMDEDEEFESDMELDVDSINDNCDFSKVPEVCDRITGEPEEEEVDSVEDDLGDGQGEPKKADDLDEATLKSENKDAIVKEAEELKKKADEYGIEYFTAMPFSEYDNDPISFEHQFPNVAKIWRSFMKEVLDIDPKDDDQVDEIWDTDIDQTDWNTVMKVIDKMVDRINKNGESTNFQITKEYTNQANANKKDDKPKDELVDDEYSESLKESTHPKEVKKPLFVIKDKHGNQVSRPTWDEDELWDRVGSRTDLKVVAYTGESLDEEDFTGARDYTIDNNETPAPGSDRTAIRNAKMIKAALIREWGDDYFDQLEIGKDKGEIVVEANKEFGHYTYVCHKDGSIDMSYSRMDEVTHTISAEDFKEFDSIKDWFEWEDIDVDGQDEPERSVQDESMTITEAPHQDEYGYIDDDVEGITPDEAKEDIDDFLEGEISIEAFRDFDNDDKELGKEEWIRQMIEFNFDADDLIQDWYENYNANSVEKIENEARDYFDDKARALLSQVWDHYAGVKEDLITDSEPSEESVDPDDNLTESDAWPWGDPGPLN